MSGAITVGLPHLVVAPLGIYDQLRRFVLEIVSEISSFQLLVSLFLASVGHLDPLLVLLKIFLVLERLGLLLLLHDQLLLCFE